MADAVPAVGNRRHKAALRELRALSIKSPVS